MHIHARTRTYRFHRGIAFACLSELVWLVDPFGFRGVIPVDYGLFLQSLVSAALVAMGTFLLVTFLRVHFVAALRREPRGMAPLSASIAAVECALLAVFGVWSIWYASWKAAVILLSLAVYMVALVSLMVFSVVWLRVSIAPTPHEVR